MSGSPRAQRSASSVNVRIETPWPLEATMTRPEASIPRDPITLAVAAHEKAIALRSATRLPEAERACRRALALYRKAEGSAHPDVANALVELGQILEGRD